MTQLFNVQMNLQESPAISNEQSSVSSLKNTEKSENTPFSSVLKDALPEKNSDVPTKGGQSSPQESSQNIDTHIDPSVKTATHLKDGTSEVHERPLEKQLLQQVDSTADRLTDDFDLLSRQQGSTSEIAAPQTQGNDQPLLQVDSDEELDIAELLASKKPWPLASQQDLAEDLVFNGHPLQLVATDQDDPLTQALNNNPLNQVAAKQDDPVAEIFPPLMQRQQPETKVTTAGEDTLATEYDTGLISSFLQGKTLPDIFNLPSNQPANVPQDFLSFAAGTKSIQDLMGLAQQNMSLTEKGLQPEPPSLPGVQSVPQTITPQVEFLLNRLQTLINNGAEAGTITIQKVNSGDNELSLRSQIIQIEEIVKTAETKQAITPFSGAKNDSQTTLADGLFAPTLRSKQQDLSGLRHDNNHQFYSAKVQPQNTLTEHSNSSTNQQGDGLGQQPQGFNQLTSSTTNLEPTTAFSLQNGHVADPLASQLSTEGKVTTLPSGAMIHDRDVIQQLVDRFQVNRRQVDSKIQMKLHPVELGKMEIDLTVKEGSIRANVVAQSQHVQEILERNINKLRSTLEQQGFNIEEITFTSQSEMVGEFDLFDQQLSDSDTYSESDNNSSNGQDSFTIDDFQTNFLDAESGVNVKA